jgi:hypothetical protein
MGYWARVDTGANYGCRTMCHHRAAWSDAPGVIDTRRASGSIGFRHLNGEQAED